MNMTLLHVFGCRCFAHIDKSLRRKNHKAKSIQCLFVGLDTDSVHGNLLYSPERNELFVSTHVVFHDDQAYDGRYTDQYAFDTLTKPKAVTDGCIDDYVYLEGTNHIDPDDGLLYKIISVEEKNYPGQGKYLSLIHISEPTRPY